MAKVVKVIVTFGGTVNIGNYSNVQPSITHEVELQDGDDPAVVTREAFHAVKEAVLDEVEALPAREANYWLRAVVVPPELLDKSN